jgi:hypothetical protein
VNAHDKTNAHSQTHTLKKDRALMRVVPALRGLCLNPVAAPGGADWTKLKRGKKCADALDAGDEAAFRAWHVIMKAARSMLRQSSH